MNNFYYGNENMPGVNDILGVDDNEKDHTPEPAPVIPKELEKEIDLSNNELFRKNLYNKDKSIKF